MCAQFVDNLSILFVDDQFIILDKLRNFFGFQAPFWNIHYVDSGLKAMEIIENDPPEVIVADSNMPGMNGKELLQKVKEFNPSILRLILSNEFNATSVLDFVGVAHQRLGKPVNMEELMDTLNMSRSLYRLIKHHKLQQILLEFDELPVPRESYFGITRCLKDSNVNIGEVAEVIKKDSVISANVLRLVNSAMFGRAERVGSISDAVMTLGISRIQSLVLMVGLLSEQRENKNNAMDVDAFSRHSLEVASQSKLVAKAMGMSFDEQESAFTAGLLQNIGKFVLIDAYRKNFQNSGCDENPYDPFMKLEKMDEDIISHPLVGAALMAVWGLPGNIINAIAHHHDPSSLSDDQMGITMPVHLAEGLVNYQRQRHFETDFFNSGVVDTQLIQKLGITELVRTFL